MRNKPTLKSDRLRLEADKELMHANTSRQIQDLKHRMAVENGIMWGYVDKRNHHQLMEVLNRALPPTHMQGAKSTLGNLVLYDIFISTSEIDLKCFWQVPLG